MCTEESNKIEVPIMIQEDRSIDNTFFLVPASLKQLFAEQRRAALLQANALGRLLDLPDVCPCCGKRKG
jgi:hypothetical protein